MVVLMFVAGCLTGVYFPEYSLSNDFSLYLLFALMFQVGISIGSGGNLRGLFAYFRPRMLLLPLATLTGTLVMSGLIGLFLTRWNVLDVMAVGGGMGYYSLSSVLIAQLKAETLGEQLAVQLGTIALLSNILREMFALTLAPLFRRYFGEFSPISAAGVTSGDVSLAAITRTCGPEMAAPAVFHGFILDMTVPFLIPLLCK